jgi:hypothetical protein
MLGADTFIHRLHRFCVLLPIGAGSNITSVENLMSAEVDWAINGSATRGNQMFRIAKRGANRERYCHEEHFLFESDS